MVDLYCLSLDFHNSCVETRSMMWKSVSELDSLREQGEILEAMPLHTCNRSELYLAIPKGSSIPEELSYQGCEIYREEKVVIHLLRVLLGLESMACGEMHITGQVKDCYEDRSHLCGRHLHRLFQGALKMSKILRSCYHPGMEPSIPYLMAEVLKEHPSFPDLKALVIGAGQMGTETARILSSMKVSTSITNRTDEKAADTASELGIGHIEWKKWKKEAGGFNALFFCTGSSHPLMDSSGSIPGKWVFDMGSPAQFRMGEDEGIRYTCIDNLAANTDSLIREYREKISLLEREARESAALLWSELSSMSGETYKRLVMGRARKIVAERANMTSSKTGASEEILQQMGWSIIKAVLSPVFEESDVHSRRVWKVLAGDIGGKSFDE